MESQIQTREYQQNGQSMHPRVEQNKGRKNDEDGLVKRKRTLKMKKGDDVTVLQMFERVIIRDLKKAVTTKPIPKRSKKTRTQVNIELSFIFSLGDSVSHCYFPNSLLTCSSSPNSMDLHSIVNSTQIIN
ncbi:hypothetical protein YC2023_005982 [Brassica napus]